MRLLLAIACAAMAFAVEPAHAGKRVALVIGNQGYRHMPALRSPARDAAEVTAALKRLGFETTTLHDADRLGLNDRFKRFAQSAAGAEIVFVYYSGHGAQFEGRNWLLPVDARLDTREDFNDADLLALDRITATLRDKSAVRIVVLDACRDNPAANSVNLKVAEAQGFKNAALPKGLARPVIAAGDLVVYATQAGTVASDGGGATSPFTASLLRHLETADLDVRQMFFRVQTDVATRHQQLPEVANSIIGEEFKLKATPPAPVAAPARPDPAPAADPAERAWGAVKDTNSIAILEEFVRRYPDTLYTAFAAARLNELKKAQVATPVPPAMPRAPPPAPARSEPQEPRLAAVAPPVVPAQPPPAVTPAVGVFPPAAVGPLSAERERNLKPGNTFRECEACPEMAVVPAGRFTMGSPDNEVGRERHEGPQRRVTLAKPFAVGRFAVTFEEWDACVAGGGCTHRPSDRGWGRGRMPAINISWNDAKAYVGWLSRRTGKTYRLLSESEREYVARAGTATTFWWGGSATTAQANFNGSGTGGEFRQRTVAVDSFPANPWGLHQVHGNIWEWTEDCWNESLAGVPADGSPWTAGDCKRRVHRGGSWFGAVRYVRAASRFREDIGVRHYMLGFRVARTLATP